MSNNDIKLTIKKVLPFILIIGGAIGLAMSFIITVEKIALLQNPSVQLACNLNPVLSCGTIMASAQANAFGFPNPFIGLAAYASLITIGMALLAGATFKRWFWIGLELGTIFGLLFVHWLIYASLYKIGALCLYCMGAWVATITIFWYTTVYNLQASNITTPNSCKKFVAFITRHHLNILLIWFLIIIGLILQHFWYFWKTVI